MSNLSDLTPSQLIRLSLAPQNQSNHSNNLKQGDLVKVGSGWVATVEKIYYDHTIARTVILLDWKEHGKSRVYADDENKVWSRVSNLN